MSTLINLAYILGLIEADGSILLMFGTGKSKTTLKPCIRITQRSNANVLPLIKKWFAENGIESRMEYWKDKGPETRESGKVFTSRAPNLIISKIPSVKTFITLVKKEKLQFVSQKQRDFYILDIVVNYSEKLSMNDKIALKKSLHKDNQNQPDFSAKGVIPRDILETRLGVRVGASYHSRILTAVDKKYEAHKNRLTMAIKNETLVVPAAWFSGLTDGDGCYYISFQVREPSPKYNKRFIEIQANYTLTMETNALLTLLVVRYLAGSNASIVQEKAHYQLWIRKQTDVNKLLTLHKKYPPIGEHRLEQYNLVIDVLRSKAEGFMRTGSVLKDLIRRVYSLKTKGRTRTFSLRDMLRMVDDIYGRYD